MSATFLVFPSLLSTMPLTTNSYWLNVVRHVEGINKFHVNHHHHSISHSSWRKFQLMYIWCDTSIQISATSLVFSSLLSLPSTVPSPTNSHVLYEVRYVEGINKFHVNHHQQTTTSSLKKISCDVMHLNVSNLPGLLLQVLLAVHGVVDHQLSCTWCLVRHIESINSLINHHNHSISHLS